MPALSQSYLAAMRSTVAPRSKSAPRPKKPPGAGAVVGTSPRSAEVDSGSSGSRPDEDAAVTTWTARRRGHADPHVRR